MFYKPVNTTYGREEVGVVLGTSESFKPTISGHLEECILKVIKDFNYVGFYGYLV